MTIDEVYTAILTGELDGYENRIRHALKERRKMKGQLLKDKLDKGDTVTVHNLSPKYINGQEAEIVEINRTRAKVRFLDPVKARRFGSGLVNVPLSNMRRVS